jgi:ribosomal protein S18 acetylase RimI-like enzyme
MTQPEFDVFRSLGVAEYAKDNVRMGEWSSEDAERLAAEQTDALLPAGLDTAGMRFLVAEDGGTVVGRVWLAVEEAGKPDAWIYDIEVEEELRGRGYGRALLAAVERLVADHGVDSVGLNVFAYNDAARRLYESAGYEATSIHMRKALS